MLIISIIVSTFLVYVLQGTKLQILGVIPFILVLVMKFFLTVDGYSDGCRNVNLEKLSKKGIVFKTWEGEGILGMSKNGDGDLVRQTWDFSMSNETLAKDLQSNVGMNVKLCYDQNYFTSFKDGNTNYFVKSFEVID